MRWTRHLTSTVEKRDGYRMLLGNPKRKWEDNITRTSQRNKLGRCGLKEMDQWRGLLNTIMGLCFSRSERKLFVSEQLLSSWNCAPWGYCVCLPPRDDACYLNTVVRPRYSLKILATVSSSLNLCNYLTRESSKQRPLPKEPAQQPNRKCNLSFIISYGQMFRRPFHVTKSLLRNVIYWGEGIVNSKTGTCQTLCGSDYLRYIHV